MENEVQAVKKFKPLKIKIPRKNPPAEPDPNQPVLTGKINDKLLPANENSLVLEDEKAFKGLINEDARLYCYNNSGQSISLENMYRNQQVFLTLSGPSLNSYDLSHLSKRGVMTMGVNNSWSVVKPNLWVSVDDPGNFLDIGWKDPTITKFVPVGHFHKLLVVKEGEGNFRPSQYRVQDMPGVYYFRRNLKFRAKSFLTENTINWGVDDDVVDELGCKGGRSVMMAAVKLLYYLGFRTIYLLGADFNMEVGKQNYAFKQDRTESSVKGNNHTYNSLNKRFTALLPEFNESGLKIYNCYKESGLKAFPYLSYDKAVAKAASTCAKQIDTEGWYDRKDKEKKMAQEKLEETK
jgi:hypothetical protein